MGATGDPSLWIPALWQSYAFAITHLICRPWCEKFHKEIPHFSPGQFSGWQTIASLKFIPAAGYLPDLFAEFQMYRG
ncbi:hypothetical protein BDW75DRAFT_224547 [Aspergillus navahoensis]